MTGPIRELRVRELRIPLTASFRHASAERAETSTVWVEALSESGVVGHGESCPRPYVTGETVASVAAFVAAHQADVLGGIDSPGALRRWVADRAPVIDANPAAWCAIELALLDALGKDSGRTVEQLLGLPPSRGPFRFTAVLGDSSPETFAATAHVYRQRGFTDFKVKLSGDLARDRTKIDALRAWGVRLRVDANNLWTEAGTAVDCLRALDYPLFGVEEPIAANRYPELARIADALGTRIVLDESVLRAGQLRELPGAADRWIVNVRVSKMGGLLRSLDVVRQARAAGIGVIVGAQVGETSLLTRAALVVATAAGPALLAQEGAFGTHLLRQDVCDPPVMFGEAGRLDPDPRMSSAPGFGLVIALPVVSDSGSGQRVAEQGRLSTRPSRP